RRDNGTGELAEVVNAQQGLTDKAIANNKYKRLSSQFKEAQANYQQRAEKDLEGYKTTLEQEATDAVALRERKVREAEVEKLKTVAKERENSLKKISLKEEVNRLDKAQHERQLMLEKDGAQNRISKLKNSYNESLNDLEQKNIASVEAMKESHLQDKTEFIKKTTEARTDEIFNLKREFSATMDKMIQDYESRLSKYERDNEYLKLTFNQKINDITQQTDKKLAEQTNLYNQKKEADTK